MANILSWGKPKIEVAAITNGTIGTYSVIDNIKENSVVIDIPEPAEKEAIGEGGEVLDVRFEATKPVANFDVYVAKGVTLPITDADGKVSGNWALKVTPENVGVLGYIIPLGVVSVATKFNSADGAIKSFKFRALKPASGNLVQTFTTT